MKSILDMDCLGACDRVCSRAYLACMGILDRLDSPPYTDEEGFDSAIRESMESVRSWDLCANVYDALGSCELLS